MRTTECNNHAICDTGRLVFLTFLQHGDWCILLEAALATACAEFSVR